MLEKQMIYVGETLKNSMSPKDSFKLPQITNDKICNDSQIYKDNHSWREPTQTHYM